MTESLLEQQLKLEAEMVSLGVSRYTASQETDNVADTYGGKSIIRQTMGLITGILEERYKSATKGRNVRALSILTAHNEDGVRVPRVAADKAMYIAIATAMSLQHKELSFTSCATSVASCIEDEIRFSEFEENYEAYYNKIQQGFKQRGSVDYRYRHRSLTHAANTVDDEGDDWVPWGTADKVLVGTYLLDIILTHTPFLEVIKVTRRNNKGYKNVLCVTQLTMDLLLKVDSFRMLLDPAYMPMIVPPKPWTSSTEGGYYSPASSKRFPFIKPSWKSNHKVASAIVDAGEADRVMKAVNRIQATPWAVNTRVHAVLKQVFEGGHGVGIPQSEPIDIPKWSGDFDVQPADMDESTRASFDEWRKEAANAHTEDRERHISCRTFLRTLSLAEKFKDYDKIYFPHNCDFRGRFYSASSGLSPQGDDIGKSLLHFGNGQTINKRGAYWLAVQGANVYGEDKISFDEREQWAIANTAAIRASATDPLSNTGFWGGADKPWQFLAFCFEWDGYCRDGFKHITQLPIALDGSCNGLQHYSALLRDSSGASATNLVGTTVPSDIYKTVANVCIGTVRAALVSSGCDNHELLEFWNDVGMDRKLAKKPVMTLPYGSTRLTCADSIQEWLKDNGLGTDALGRQKLAWALTPYLWDSIGEVVVAARAGMDWLQQVSREVSRDNKPLAWSSLLGFPIIQRSMKTEVVRVRTQLMGTTFRPNVQADTDQIDPRKQASGIAPNFTHGNDATHLAMTVLENGDCDYAMIHDSFGCHANGIDKLHVSIRVAFFDMYSQDILGNFITDTGTTIPAPELGDYDLNDIHAATYFFG